MAANEIFGEEESNQENNFEGFTAQELAEARAGLSRNQVEDDDDISVDEYKSESEDSSTEDTIVNNDNRAQRPRARGRNNNGAAQNQDRIWTETFTKTTIPNYSEILGPKVILDASKTELDFFNLLFPLNLCAWIANETNHYATQVQAQKGEDSRWYETDLTEIRVFIGMRVYMSIIDLPDIKMYWSEDNLFGGFPIANVMCRSRFESYRSTFM